MTDQETLLLLFQDSAIIDEIIEDHGLAKLMT